MIVWLFILSRIVFVVITSIVFAISLISYSRLPNRKSLLLLIGFALFFVHGLISIPEIFNQTYNRDFTDSLHLLIDAAAILLILIGVLKD